MSSCTQMGSRVRVFLLLQAFSCMLLGTLNVRPTHASVSDIYCLKSIKESLEDPFNNLQFSWNFNNKTEGFICKFAGVECWHPHENKVLNIRLSNMGLKGQFPRGIENCSSLTGLDLSNNHLSGPLPSDISTKLSYLTSLDLSSNNFSGEIPSGIANLSYLNVLRLDNNQITGHIPSAIGQLQRLRTFSVSNNLLSGPLPDFGYPAFPSGSYANNPGLCGHPLDPCKAAPILNEFRALFWSGFAVGWGFATFLVVLLVTLFGTPRLLPAANRIITTNTKDKRKKKVASQPGSQRPATKERSKDLQGSTFDSWITRMSFAELNQATENFSIGNLLGLGKMGLMYKAVLPNGVFVAIKRFHDSQQFEGRFVSEIKTLGKLRHTNLVPLLGFCSEMNERLLVYKYMSNGNLYDQLHPVEVEAKTMGWPLRVKIAVGTARGIAWLHYNKSNFRVVHNNISSKSILLDQNFEPKISNFGRATGRKLSHTDSRSSAVNDQEDVYCFGIVLLELVTGEEPDKVANSSESFEGSLVEWIAHLTSCSSGLYDAIDKSLVGQGFDGEIFQFLRVAYNCVQSSADQRPTMLEVYKNIVAVGERHGLEDDSAEIMIQTENTAANTRGECTAVEITEEIE